MTAAGDNLDRAERNARQYLTSPDFPDGWIEPHEITDAAAPDLILARDVLALAEIARAAQACAENSAIVGDEASLDASDVLTLAAALARLDTKEGR